MALPAIKNNSGNICVKIESREFLLEFVRPIIFILALFPMSLMSAESGECVPMGKVLIPSENRVISHVELASIMSGRSVVLLGEHHDNAEHHRWQLQMLAGLHVANKNLAVGFEMFPRRMQGVLDRWVAGELSEREFLKEVEWDKYWRFDADLYMPLFHYARMNGIPIYALNVERDLIRKVGAKGWEGVTDDEREGITQPAPPSEGYQLMLASVFSQHGSKHPGSEGDLDKEALKAIIAMPAFQNFVDSQQVWDRAMAQEIARVVVQQKPDMFIAIMGSGHMMNFHGVPHQLADLGIEQPAVLVPWAPEFECRYISATFADAVIGLKAETDSASLQAENRPRLGVYLEPADNGVKIIRVVEHSLAEESGIEQGDVVVEMAGRAITDVQSIIDIVKGMQWGTWLPVTVMRGDKQLELVAKFPPSQDD